ncbi:DUF3604 domain-containing protein [Sphingorhabdus arenilitoris]|uniref:DUF3604 domain-containing protein n=1 Tax=Sphingorhabdus arenilitoris TaxID=1490041 RepID=A0ABV8RIF8_9SPHN
MRDYLKRTLLGCTAIWAVLPQVAEADEADRRQALFGDLHVHTQYSFDAYIFGVRRTPDDAYRYALGEKLRHAGGYDIQLKGGPLDFYAVTDHAEYIGILPAMNDPASPMSKLPYAADMFSNSADKILAAFSRVTRSMWSSEPAAELNNEGIMKSSWQEIQAAADRYYRPGQFTTFIGFEYTSAPNNANLHRVVLFRGKRVPDLPFSTFNSPNPEKLWAWLDDNRGNGIEGLAIPHNSNVSDGRMFETTNYAGDPITAEYAMTRMRNEPIVEMSQVKGTSDTHPALSPNDEWANFELYETLLGTAITGKTSGSYVRQALQRGLEIEQKTGVNPYKFGLIGSSDTHNAGGPVEEDEYFGKTGLIDGSPETRRVYESANDATLKGPAATPFYEWSAAGLTGVWAERNNREDIYAAFRRKETFATSGPRIKVRLFAGYGYPNDIFGRPDFAALAYKNGVPMGGDLKLSDKGAPTFLAQAIKDPNSAGVERLQIIRGWVENGVLKERVFDIACAAGAPGPKNNRCQTTKASIDASNCLIDKSDGAAELKVNWRDPDFSSKRRAFYYVRVIERPTCRWSTWEANRLGKRPRPGLPLTIQERAWSSPIWIGAS